MQETPVIHRPMENRTAVARAGAPNPDRNRNLRLGFEAVLVALCAYLIGVAGLPPLFDAPQGPGEGQFIASAPTAEEVGDAEAATQTEPETETVNQTPGAGVSVTAGRATWSTAYFQAALFRELLEELGYTVNDPGTKEQGPTDMFRSMAGGEVDFWSNTWLPNHNVYIDEELADGSMVGDRLTTVGNLLPLGGLEGLVMTKSVADEFGVLSLDQINSDPELVELFDGDGNGLADLHGCPEDWGCHKIIKEQIQFNGWANVEQISQDFDAMFDTVEQRVEDGLPAMIYIWSPSGYLTRLRPGDNVLWLSVGGQENMMDGSTSPEYDFNDAEPPTLGAACTSDPCYLGWLPADIKVTATNEFLEANPSARVLFEQAQLKVLDVALANVKYDTGETTPEDLERHAQQWMTENRETVDQWLAAARAAG